MRVYRRQPEIVDYDRLDSAGRLTEEVLLPIAGPESYPVILNLAPPQFRTNRDPVRDRLGQRSAVRMARDLLRGASHRSRHVVRVDCQAALNGLAPITSTRELRLNDPVWIEAILLSALARSFLTSTDDDGGQLDATLASGLDVAFLGWHKGRYPLDAAIRSLILQRLIKRPLGPHQQLKRIISLANGINTGRARYEVDQWLVHFLRSTPWSGAELVDLNLALFRMEKFEKEKTFTRTLDLAQQLLPTNDNRRTAWRQQTTSGHDLIAYLKIRAHQSQFGSAWPLPEHRRQVLQFAVRYPNSRYRDDLLFDLAKRYRGLAAIARTTALEAGRPDSKRIAQENALQQLTQALALYQQIIAGPPGDQVALAKWSIGWTYLLMARIRAELTSTTWQQQLHLVPDYQQALNAFALLAKQLPQQEGEKKAIIRARYWLGRLTHDSDWLHRVIELDPGQVTLYGMLASATLAKITGRRVPATNGGPLPFPLVRLDPLARLFNLGPSQHRPTEVGPLRSAAADPLLTQLTTELATLPASEVEISLRAILLADPERIRTLTPESMQAIDTAAAQAGLWHLAYRLHQLHESLDRYFPIAFSTAFDALDLGALSRARLTGIMRQESAYNWAALSPRDARSLLQVLPENYPNGMSDDEHYVPVNNIQAGHQVLNRELLYFAERFESESDLGLPIAFDDAVFIASAAAYNAGRPQVLAWLKRNPPQDGFDWFVEDITFDETHDYVELTFYYVNRYKVLYRWSP